MKKAQSQLIRNFLAHVQLGSISANDMNLGGTRAFQSLEVMVAVLEAILDGISPEIALDITRAPGPNSKTKWLSPDFNLARRIHELRARDEKWLVIADLTNVSQAKCKRLHRDYSDEVRQFEELRGLLKSSASPKDCEP